MNLSINTYLILMVVILLTVDVFMHWEIPSFLSYLIVTYIITAGIPLGIADPITRILIRVLIAIIVFIGLFLFHYKVFKKFNNILINKHIAPDKHKDGLSSFVGKIGVIKEVEGRLFIKINDEILLFSSNDSFQNGDEGEVVGYSGSSLTINKRT